MQDQQKQTEDKLQDEPTDRRVQADALALGLAERRRFGNGFAPLDDSSLSTDEAMKAYLDLLQERRSDNPQN